MKVFLRRGAIILGVVALAYFVLCWEEDARGAREWKAALAHLRSIGEPTDYATLIPPLVPEKDNLGAIPLFRLTFDSPSKAPEPSALIEALKNSQMLGSDNPKSDWIRGEAFDDKEWNKQIAERFHKAFPQQPAPPSPLEKLDLLCPALSDLRQASVTRPECRFAMDYTTQPPWNRSFGLAVQMLALSKALDLHAMEALQANDPSLALEDLRVEMKLDSGLREDPTLISGLVAIAVMSIQLGAVWQGLSVHQWTDSQLAEIQGDLARVDFLSEGRLCLRGEALGFFAPTMDYIRDRPATLTSVIVANFNERRDESSGLRLLWATIPTGCFDATKAQGLERYFQAAREPFDLRLHRVFPDKYAAIEKHAADIRAFTPTDLLLRVSIGPVISSVIKFAQQQCRVDEARIACMIERYRLAHGFLPASLDLLASYGGVPLDLCNGQPYHYAVRTDGTFLLYSVGWNQKDDGGKVVVEPSFPKRANAKEGDWVWPQPGHPGT